MDILENSILMPLLCRPGTLVDVGANFGECAYCLSTVKDARVVAFEPVVQTFIGMCTLIAQAAGGELPANLTVYNLGLGAGIGPASIAIPYFNGIRWEGRASVVKDFGEMARQTDKVEVSHVTQDIVSVPLDMFDIQDATFLKIDVEGFEKEVIQGAAGTIARCRPVIHVEIEEQHRKNATIEVPALLASLDYRGFFFLDRTLRDFAEFDRTTMQKSPPLPRTGELYPITYIGDFIFVHKQDAWALQRLAEIAGHLMSERFAAEPPPV